VPVRAASPSDNSAAVRAVIGLEQGRAAFAREAWLAAYESLCAADRSDPLRAGDLELLATSAYMLGRETEYLNALERAHRAHLDAGQPLAAVRCAFWIGVTLASGGEIGRAGGWLGRAHRILEELGEQGVERGYLELPTVFALEASGDLEAAAETAAEAAAIGRRHDDPDLFALAAQEHGYILIRLGQIDAGVRLLDEAMVAAAAGELSPIVSGIVYCGVILACREAHEVGRAQEWTAALSAWCERQPDLVAFTGRCLIHRAELMQMKGAWREALAEATRAEERCARAGNARGVGEACYRRGELHRLQGNLGQAERAFREASAAGREPQPGLALLRLAQGKRDAARTAARRLLTETAEPGRRGSLLPACVEIFLAAGDTAGARAAADELAALAAGHEAGALEAIAAHARGSVELAEGDPAAALVSLRRAEALWRQLDSPYECARARELIARCCLAVGDEDAAALELAAASRTYTELGAQADARRVASPVRAHGLTGRELEVLRLVAAGRTNRAIAAELVLSERTVDRHVSNIFAKLRVASRAAATAFAYEHGLL
jgi:DNA-binding CsgD family transcriptional regulator